MSLAPRMSLNGSYQMSELGARVISSPPLSTAFRWSPAVFDARIELSGDATQWRRYFRMHSRNAFVPDGEGGSVDYLSGSTLRLNGSAGNEGPYNYDTFANVNSRCDPDEPLEYGFNRPAYEPLGARWSSSWRSLPLPSDPIIPVYAQSTVTFLPQFQLAPAVNDWQECDRLDFEGNSYADLKQVGLPVGPYDCRYHVQWGNPSGDPPSATVFLGLECHGKSQHLTSTYPTSISLPFHAWTIAGTIGSWTNCPWELDGRLVDNVCGGAVEMEFMPDAGHSFSEGATSQGVHEIPVDFESWLDAWRTDLVQRWDDGAMADDYPLTYCGETVVTERWRYFYYYDSSA